MKSFEKLEEELKDGVEGEETRNLNPETPEGDTKATEPVDADAETDEDAEGEDEEANQ